MPHPVNKLERRLEIHHLVEGTPLWLSEVGMRTPSSSPVIENLLMWLWHDLGIGGSGAEVDGHGEGSILEVLHELHADFEEVVLGDHGGGVSGVGRLENFFTHGLQVGPPI